MTTFEAQKQTCGVCGVTVETNILTSTNEFGSPDLDLRPPEMKRSTMIFWLNECPSCHYVAPDITKAPENVLDVLKSPEYQEYLSNVSIPDLANKFIRNSLLLKDDTEKCGMSKLHAAWICDDKNLPDLASKLRSDSADVLFALRPLHDNEENMTIGAILVDVLRRSGRFNEAIEIIQELTNLSIVKSHDIVPQVLDFQMNLCETKDQNNYKISDALDTG
jgi:hypothetical protein